MARQRIVPIAVAFALTVAAGLSITAEHMRRHAAATQVGPLTPIAGRPATDPAHDDAVPERGDSRAVQRASDTAPIRPPSSVGSRALVGDDADN